MTRAEQEARRRARRSRPVTLAAVNSALATAGIAAELRTARVGWRLVGADVDAAPAAAVHLRIARLKDMSVDAWVERARAARRSARAALGLPALPETAPWNGRLSAGAPVSDAAHRRYGEGRWTRPAGA